jgi:hypothetical protein
MFFDLYSAPLSSQHRYWPGLLLFARTIVYTVSAANISSNTHVNIFTTGILASGLFILKGLLGTRLYKQKLVEIIEVICYVNILGFCFGWLYFSNSIRFKSVLLYVSESITLFLFCIVFIYHAYTEFLVGTKLVKLLMEKLKTTKIIMHHLFHCVQIYQNLSHFR